MIDTHAHLDALDDADGALARARDAGVTQVVTIGTTIASCRRALELADQHEGVFAALGVHPHGAGEAWEEELEELRALLSHPRVVAVGETGLDHYRDYAPHDRQLELFRAQVGLAEELQKPLIVHTRAADEETLQVLRALAPDTRVVLHCFSSTALLEPALESGWYVSFAGNVTYPKAPELRWAAEQIPADRLLAETDSPYLPPQPIRGRPNEPANVAYTYAALAEARGEDVEELGRQVESNAAEAFELP